MVKYQLLVLDIYCAIAVDIAQQPNFHILRHILRTRGVTLLTDYALKCADVVGTDGTVTTMDAMRINAHAKGSNLLW